MGYITVEVDQEKCDKCYECVISCPTDALKTTHGIFTHNAYACSYCEVCMDVCPFECIKIMDM
jgi:NAD-dependent dihydropyrimidine dehydrogenase PreA subunit